MQDVGLNDHSSDDEKTRVRTLLDCHTSVFRTDDTAIGHLGVTKHRIELWDSIPSIRSQGGFLSLSVKKLRISVMRCIFWM